MTKLRAHIETEQQKHTTISSIEVLRGKDGHTPTEEELTTLINKQGFIKEYIESDPTVPSWAKQPNKPKYTASEVGALPDDTKLFSGNYNDLANKPNIPTVPSNVSAFTNDAGYITGYTETDPTVPSWAKQPSKPTYTWSEITNRPTLSSVATSGSYNDLTNKPTIPTVPTNVSSFTNDAGYITSSQADATYAKKSDVPAAVTDDHINSLIDAKLGVIENGSY